MATAPDWNCPICREASVSIAYVSSCLHQFCRPCIMRWARNNPSCPLCRQAVRTIIYPAPPDQGFVEMALPPPRSPGLAELPPRPPPPPPSHGAGLPPETWARFFRNHAEVLRPVEVWLNEVLCGACWWDVAFAQGRIVASLCRYGLNEEALLRELQPFLQDQTASFVRRLIYVATNRCGETARHRTEGPGPQAAAPAAGAGSVAVLAEGTAGSTAAQQPRQAPQQAAPAAARPGRRGRAPWQSPRPRGYSPPKKLCRRGS